MYVFNMYIWYCLYDWIHIPVVYYSCVRRAYSNIRVKISTSKLIFDWRQYLNVRIGGHVHSKVVMVVVG